MLDFDRLRAAYEKAKGELLAERTPHGHWVGELSSSALSTATAVSALAVVRKSVGGRTSKVERREGVAAATFDLGPSTFDDLIARGVVYLAGQQNADGGFGDTDLSHSNIATTYLVVAALHLADAAEEHRALLARADAYLESKGRLAGLRERYGIDKTFVVPIMTNLAIAGLLDWREIDQLPFELATVPQAWYRFVGMPVVSYAIPALVAIGQAQFYHAPPWNPLKRLVRWLSITRSLKVLRRMQPDSGGYLEATPLTSFVVMSLASCRRPEGGPLAPQADESRGHVHPTDVRSRSERTTGVADQVIFAGVKFLVDSIRPDGSWPIDTNLATWNTTLAINALAGAGEDVAELLGVNTIVRNVFDGVYNDPDPENNEWSPGYARPNVLSWLISCQHLQRHPFTGADAGGFGWSNLSGAVPDADDTPGALLAIHAFDSSVEKETLFRWMPDDSTLYGLAGHWLRTLQNADGGWPTFCRGWGKLPFDRSGTDLTAHALRALAVWHRDPTFADHPDFLKELRPTFKTRQRRALEFLRNRQHPDGSWSPLWFGNQDHPDEDNPVYGTAKVLMAYRDLRLMDSPEAQRGVAWLVANQNADGGWGSGVWEKAESGKRKADGGQPALGSPLVALSPPLTSSVEETALAVEALLAACPESADFRPPTSDLAPPHPSPLAPNPSSAAARGLAWLIARVEAGQHRQPAPIGFYFAKLWYYEKLYPLTFTVAALGRACRQFAPTPPDQSAADRQLEPAAPAASRDS
jgi:squalene-hopene/tetraprenyl-beta-curcumene cyclase